MRGRPRQQQSFGGKLLTGLGHAAKFAGAAHSAYHIAKAGYHVAAAAAPYVAAALL